MDRGEQFQLKSERTAGASYANAGGWGCILGAAGQGRLTRIVFRPLQPHTNAPRVWGPSFPRAAAVEDLDVWILWTENNIKAVLVIILGPGMCFLYVIKSNWNKHKSTPLLLEEILAP